MVMCPRCGRANEGKYRFCLGCGAALPAHDLAQGGGGAPAAPAAAPAGPALRSGAGAAPLSRAAPASPAVPVAPPAASVPPPVPAQAPPAGAPPAAVPAHLAALEGFKAGPAPALPPKPASAATAQPFVPAGGAAPKPGARVTAPGDDLPTEAVSSLISQLAGLGAATANSKPRIATGPNHNPAEVAALAGPSSFAGGLDGGTRRQVPRPLTSSEAKTVPPGSTLPGFQLSPSAAAEPSPRGSATPGSLRSPVSRYAPPPPPASVRAPGPIYTTPAATPMVSDTPGAPGIPAAASAHAAPPPTARAAATGTAASQRCNHCGTDVPFGNAFCGSCGTPMPRQAPAAAAPVPQSRPNKVGYVALIDDNGTESLQFPLVQGENRIGSGETCQLRFPDDGFLASIHCAVDAEPGQCSLRPIDQANGVFVRITAPVELHHGDVLRIGQEVLRFERLDKLSAESNADGHPETVGWPLPKGVWGRLCQMGLGRQVANAYLLASPDVFLGRERGDILFPRDGFVSGSHAVLSDRNGRGFLKDLVSSNGTFVKAKHETPLRNGDLFLLGRNLLRLHLGAPA